MLRSSKRLASTLFVEPSRLLVALLLLCGVDIVGAQFSEATDATALRAFKVGSNDFLTATWTADTSPCGAGWNNLGDGWFGVVCCANGPNSCDTSTNNARRVSTINLDAGTYDLPGGLIGVRGNLADLAGLTALRFLFLGYTNTHGDIAHLLGLTLLEGLNLANTHVYGNAVAIRATIPGLSSWGGRQRDFTACSAFAACPAGTSPVVGGDDVVGNDECPCCDRSRCCGLTCGADEVCSRGSCVSMCDASDATLVGEVISSGDCHGRTVYSQVTATCAGCMAGHIVEQDQSLTCPEMFASLLDSCYVAPGALLLLVSPPGPASSCLSI